MEKSGTTALRTGILTTAALIAFAANSIFCRLALREGSIDPASFTTLRLVSGAIVLALICRVGGWKRALGGGWQSGLLLFFYAAPFSFAYVDLSAGTGALILFGAVQITMIASEAVAGRRPSAGEWTGLVLAFSGLVWLVVPGIEAPSLSGSLLMCVAGAAWGLYTVRGKSSASPIADTAGNFARAAVPAILVSLVGSVGMAGAAGAGANDIQPAGAVYALASGVLASGLGYTVWYSALRGMTGVRAAVVQLSVPVITALAGVALLSESITLRLLTASVMVLGGIEIAIVRSGKLRDSGDPAEGAGVGSGPGEP